MLKTSFYKFNFIKESKNEFNFSSMSSHDHITNKNRLMIAAIAYNIYNLFRRLYLTKAWQTFRATEIRICFDFYAR